MALRRAPVVLLAQICAVASCVSAPEDGVGADLTQGSGGGGGQAGAPFSCYGTFYPEVEECGECRLTLEHACIDSDCSLPEDLTCDIYGSPRVYIDRGCGYVKRESVEHDGSWDVYSRTTHTWLEETGELVHYYSDRSYNSCKPDTSAGSEPYCEEWVESCESDPGFGGFGGFGRLTGFGGASP